MGREHDHKPWWCLELLNLETCPNSISNFLMGRITGVGLFMIKLARTIGAPPCQNGWKNNLTQQLPYSFYQGYIGIVKVEQVSFSASSIKSSMVFQSNYFRSCVLTCPMYSTNEAVKLIFPSHPVATCRWSRLVTSHMYKYIYIYIHLHICIYTYIYMYDYMDVFYVQIFV